MIKKFFTYATLLICLVILNSCHDHDKKILGSWQKTGIEDGCQYVETFMFYGEEEDNRFEHSYIPQDFSHIGFQAKGRWSTDLVGNLELFYDLKTVKPVYNYYVDNPLEDFNINMYINTLKAGFARQNDEMEDVSIGLEFKNNKMILETLSGKEYYNKINASPKAKNSNKERKRNNLSFSNRNTSEDYYSEYEEKDEGTHGLEEEEETAGDLDDFDWVTQRYVTPDDLSWRSKEGLRILRNWIFARHGYKFNSKDLIQYFSQYPWYTPRFDNVNSQLSEIELYNIDLIKKYEDRL